MALIFLINSFNQGVCYAGQLSRGTLSVLDLSDTTGVIVVYIPQLTTPDPRSIDDMQVANLPESAMDQGSAVVSREFYFMTLSIFHTDCPVKTRNNYDLIPDPLNMSAPTNSLLLELGEGSPNGSGISSGVRRR